MRFVGVGSAISSGVKRFRIQAFGFCFGHLREPRPQRRDPAAVLVGGETVAGSQRDVDHRIDVDRHHHAAGELRRVPERLVVADDAGRFDGVGLRRPIELGTAATGAGAGAPRLASREQHEVGAALLDVAGGLVRHGCT